MAEMGSLSARRTAAALVLLALVAAVTVGMGRWQLQRADERRAIRAAIEAGRRATPLALHPATPAGQLRPWRPALAEGTWRNDLTVLIDNRNLDGRPGLWVATPLAFAGQPEHAVLVLRGWLPRRLDGQPLQVPAGGAGMQRVRGELAERVPRLFDLAELTGGEPPGLPAGWPHAGGTPAVPPRVQNLDLAAYARATGLQLLPAVLQQTDHLDDGLRREWPQPSVDADQNIGYAVQWFGFATIAAIAWLALAVRAWRRRHAARRTSD